ncbi:alkaline phosphatase D family protein [Nocardia sp. NPDC005366]|uniref:alkaline phosphatase D family protein n=1 Tax=Nocardia sp. NPDC005366 TaxID=3156878 RepID=UPI0033AF4859
MRVVKSPLRALSRCDHLRSQRIPLSFGAYRHLAARDDLDAIVHLGDYIYENDGTGGG